MPSAATNASKSTDKPVEPGTTEEKPLNTIVTIIEHKIRNLEKRKTRLDGLREVSKNGTKLTSDQRDAVKKYDEVLHSLELAKDLCKQFSQIVKEANRDAKRESKRNAFLKIQQESAKVREVLIIQDILRSLADDSVRQDFLDGTNGAVKIEQADMDLLEKLYVEVTPKRPTRSDEPSFVSSANHSANTLSSVIDSRPKPFAESTYEHVREILVSIRDSGYFEKDILQLQDPQSESAVDGGESESIGVESDDVTKTEDSGPSELIEAPAAKVVPVPEQLMMGMVPPQVPVKAPVYPQLPPNAVAVGAVEYGLQKQYLQTQVRPIHEVIGPANFFFLQDSEIDPADDFVSNPQPSPQTAPLLQPPTAQPVLPPNAPFAQAPPFPPHALKDIAPPPHIPPFATQIQQLHAPPPGSVPLAQPVQQIMQQIPGGFPVQNPAQIAQMAQLQTIIQQGQLQPDTNALTEKLKSTLHITSEAPKATPAPKPAVQTQEEDADWSNDGGRNSADNGNSNSWSNEGESGGYQRFKPRNSGGFSRSDKYVSNKYGDGKYGGDKYGSSSYRGNRSNNGAYQNGGSSVFFQNNDRSYYPNGNGSGGGGYKGPRNDLMRSRGGMGERGNGSDYRNQRGAPGSSSGNRGDRVKA